MGRKRGRGYVGQFSRNSMGRDRHSNPRYPPSTLSGSCSLFKQASNSILGLYSLTLSPPLSLSSPISLFLFLSPFLAIRLSAAAAYHIRLSLSVSLSFDAPNSNPRTVVRDFNSCDNYLDFSRTGSDGSIIS